MGDKVGIREPGHLPEPGEAGDLDADSGGRSLAVVAVVGLALILATVPAIVAGLGLGDSTLLQGARLRVHDAFGWLAYLGYARLFLFLPLAAMVIRAKEEA
jgi:hypothetical protein